MSNPLHVEETGVYRALLKRGINMYVIAYTVCACMHTGIPPVRSHTT